MLYLLKNPIVFGALVGIVLCLLLFANDKFLAKKDEDKSGVLTYVKIFLAGFVATAPLVFLFFNRNLSFKNPNAIEKVVKTAIQDAGAAPAQCVASFVDDVSHTSVEQAVEAVKSVESVGDSLKDVSKSHKLKVKGLKKCHADVPDW